MRSFVLGILLFMLIIGLIFGIVVIIDVVWLMGVKILYVRVK